MAEDAQGAATATVSPVSAPQGSGGPTQATPSSPQDGAGLAPLALIADMQADSDKLSATSTAQGFQGDSVPKL